MSIIYFGLGANLGDRRASICEACDLLSSFEMQEVRCSSLRETDAVGFSSQNRFLNAAAWVKTKRSPEEWLLYTKEVEYHLGRMHKSEQKDDQLPIYHDRPIDIDLLLYDDVVLSRPDLIIPHPQMLNRPFVLEPLAEIAPGTIHPIYGQTMAELWKAVQFKNKV